MSRYRQDIDGLRAVAVLAVVLFHAGVPGFTGGFVGVDVFFVISGFLITGILVRSLEDGTFSFPGFFERRFRRLLPASLVMVAVTTLLAMWVLTPQGLIEYGESVIATGAYLSNAYFWRTAGYFDGPSELKPLLHTWSLAVEEQYYIVMPVLLWGICRLGGRYRTVLFPIALGSFAFSAWGVSAMPTSTFFLLPSRFWELLVGGLLALDGFPRARSRGQAEGMGWLGLALVVMPVLVFDGFTPFPGPAALAPCLGTMLLLQAGRDHTTLLGRWLSAGPLVAVGLVSYSFYLWHWPLLVLLRHGLLRTPTVVEALLAVALAFALAGLSYRFVEQPFRRPRPEVGAGRVIALGVLGGLATAAVGAALIGTEGLPGRFDVDVAPPVAARPTGCMIARNKGPEGWKADKCTFEGGRDHRVLLWGDSLAAHFSEGIRAAESPSATYYMYAQSECLPALGYTYPSRPRCGDVNDGVFDMIDTHGIDTVVMAARWELPFKRRDWGAFEKLGKTVERLKSHGVAVYVIEQSPVFAMEPYDLFLRSGLSTTDDARAPTHVHDQVNARLRNSVQGAQWIALGQELCDASGCLYRADGNFLFADTVHFSKHGSERVGGLLPYL